MESARDFLLNYFAARTREVERELAAHQPFRKKYFADSCLWESRPLAVEMSKSEKIISVAEEEDTVVAITERLFSAPAFRYTLRRQQDNWQILRIQPVCADCSGKQGNFSCVICQGSGWLQIPPA